MTNSSNPIADALYGAFQVKQEPPRYARVTQVPLDANLRTQGYVVADIDGNSVQIKIGPSDTFYPGDTLMAQRSGSKAAASYTSLGFVSGTRPDAGMGEIPANTTVGGVNYGAGDQYLGALTGANWWFKYANGVFVMRQAAIMTGALGNLNGLYGYAVETWGAAFGQYGAGKVWIATDPTNGFRIANYTTPIFQADTAGVVWALSTFRAGTGNDTVGMIATDATWRLYVGHATPSLAPFRVDKAGNATATAATIGGTINATAGTFSGLVHIGSGTPHLHLDGVNALLESSTYVVNSAGWRISASGLAEFGNVKATGGTIGGWTAATDKLSAGNITLDAGLGRIQLGTGGPELVLNGDFALYSGTQDNGVADTFTGWTFGFTAPNRAEATATAYTGRNALLLVRSNSSGMDTYQEVTVVPGAVYRCTAYVRGEVTLRALDWTNSPVTLGTQTGVAGSTYQRLTFDITAPAGCVKVLVMLTPASTNGSYYVGAVSVQRTDGAATDYIRLEPGAIQSNYVPGSTGWRISAAGNAEFGNVTVRGAIKASVFEKGTISAFAGGLIVAKSAGKLAATYTVGGTLTIETPAIGGWVFDTNDIVRFKAEYATGMGDTWITVTRTATTNVYTTTYQSGTNSITYPAGTACVDYGVSGQGYFAVAADGTFGASAAWVLRSHAGAPWTTETTHVYAGTDGKLYAGGGSLVIDSNYITIFTQSDQYPSNGYVFASAANAQYGGLLGWHNTTDRNVSLYSWSNTLTPYAIVRAMTPTTSGKVAYARLSAYTGMAGTEASVECTATGDVTAAITLAAPNSMVSGTLHVGGTTAAAEKLQVTGNALYTGDLKPYRNATAYTGYVFVPLTAPLTSASYWNGQGYSTTAKTLIDLSAVFGAPAGIKAILTRLICRDSGSLATANLSVMLSPNNTAGETPTAVRPSGLPNDAYAEFNGVTPCDANGDVYYQIAASGTGTMDVWVQIWGYWI